METLKSINPANGEIVGEVPVTPVATIGEVVARARAAQPAWEGLGVGGRRAMLTGAADRLNEKAEEIGRLICMEMGKPVGEAIGEVKSCAGGLVAGLDEIAAALAPELLEDERTRSTLYYDPYGVCACITPWNFPLMMPHWLIVPALMAGNTVVFKPSEETPLTGQAYAEALQAGLPDGVLEIVHGADAQGKALVAAADVDLIAFTGSRDAGRQIMAAASAQLKRVILELGGKDPLVVLDDADIAAAAKFAARNGFRNAGQVCVSTERVYVQAGVWDPFAAALVAETSKLVQGDGMAEGTEIGPMVSGRQRDHVLAQIDDAVERGAKVLHGGTGHHDNYIVPTVLSEVTHEMPIARDETFGPVVCLTRVSGDEEAIALANDTEFGLGAVVFGEEEHAERVARRLKAGMIGVNRGCGGATGAPWVGARQSGYGFHSSPAGHRQFAQPRVVSRAK